MPRHKVRFRLICVGKTEGGFVQDGVNHYTSRIAPFAALDFKEIRAAAHSGRDQAGALDREGEAILSSLAPAAYLALLDEHGQQFSTREFADWLRRVQQEAGAGLAFLIGGAYGVSPAVAARADARGSLSRMTLPH